MVHRTGMSVSSHQKMNMEADMRTREPDIVDKMGSFEYDEIGSRTTETETSSAQLKLAAAHFLTCLLALFIAYLLTCLLSCFFGFYLFA